MKLKVYLFLTLGGSLVFRLQTAAQTIEVTGTGVGIGTTSPAYSLHSTGSIGVEGGQQFIARYNGTENYKATFGWSHLQLGNNGPNWIVAGRTQAGGAMSFIVNNTTDYAYASFNGVVAMHLAANGNVGVGTTSPNEPFTVIRDGVDELGSSPRMIANFRNGAGTKGLYIGYDNNEQLATLFPQGGSGGISIWSHDGSAWGERWRVHTNGNVGIGASSPSQKLEVAGSVRATSFIANANTYADFVFKPNYKLASLSEVEASIKTHGHLPDIPSEAEAKARGIDLAQMQVKLLQKVEEMTLYLLSHEKTLQGLQQELQQLREKNETLERRLLENH